MLYAWRRLWVAHPPSRPTPPITDRGGTCIGCWSGQSCLESADLHKTTNDRGGSNGWCATAFPDSGALLMPLTPADVRYKQFNTTRLRPGYDEEEVDALP